MFVIQVAEILWTKATRGAPRANERASLARSFPIDIDAAECLVQHHRMAEWEDSFAPRLTKLEKLTSIPGSLGILRISPEEEGAFALGVLGTPHSGQPKRRAVDGALRLLPGQWARLVVNARHTSYSGQYYSETIFNVACGPKVASHLFLLGAPDQELDLKADLF